MKPVKLFQWLLSVGLALTLCACGGSSDSSSISSSAEISSLQSAVTSTASSEESISFTEAVSEDDSSVAEPNPKGTDFTVDDIPAYTGTPSVVINNNVPFFEPNEETTDAFQHYFDLDNLGRVTLAYASLGPELLPEGERGDISSVHPTGFENESYPWIDGGGGMVYNRCHLIAYMLAGQNANPKNLMTGTRYMNVEGMLPYEQQTDDYIKKTGNHVMYRVTPLFKGDDLVAQGVLMEAKSVEDKGAGLQFCVFCYNVEPGVAIDYATGLNHTDGTIAAGGVTGESSAAKPEAEQPAPQPAAPAQDAPAAAQQYVVNTNTHKFHYPWCSSVSQMKAKNRMDVTETRDSLISQGYSPCKRCNP